METASARSSALHTTGAIVLALVTWLIVDALVTAFLVLLDTLLTLMRPEIIGFINNIIGAAVGVFAAGVLADKWVPRYSGKAVAVAFFVVSALIVFAEWFVLSNPAHPIMVTAGAVTTVIVAFKLFWRGIDA